MEVLDINLFELYASLTLDTQGYEDGLNDAESKTSGFGEKLKSGLTAAAKVGAAALGVAATGIVALTKQSIDAYAEYEQLVGGVETLFQGSADTVMQYANNAFQTAGLSANQYMETVTSFSASLLSSLGGDTAAAADYADQAIVDMADNANKMGTSMESIQNAYQGFAKQNYTMLDNLKLGYGGTKEEMERLINDANRVREANGEMADLSIDSFADVVEAIHTIQEEMGIAGATSQEASTTIQGSVSAMKAAWQNLVTGLADPSADLGALMGDLIDSVVTVGDNVIPVITGLLPRIAEGITMLAGAVVPMIPGLLDSMLPGLISGAESILNSFVAVLPSIITTAVAALPQLVSAAMSIISNLVSALISVVPQILTVGGAIIEQLISGITTGIPNMVSQLPQVIDGILNFITEQLPTVLEKGGELLGNLATGIIQAIPQLVGQLPEIITSFTSFITSNLPKIVTSGIELLGQLAAGIIQAIPDLIAVVPDLLLALANAFVGLASTVIEIGSNIVAGIRQGIANAWDALTTWVTAKFTALVDGVKSVLGIASPSKVFAQIGSYMAEGLGAGWDSEYANIKRSIEDDMNFGTANVGISVTERQTQALNGLTSVVLANNTGFADTPVHITLVTPDGDKFAEWQLPSLIRVASASGTPIVSTR